MKENNLDIGSVMSPTAGTQIGDSASSQLAGKVIYLFHNLGNMHS